MNNPIENKSTWSIIYITENKWSSSDAISMLVTLNMVSFEELFIFDECMSPFNNFNIREILLIMGLGLDWSCVLSK